MKRLVSTAVQESMPFELRTLTALPLSYRGASGRGRRRSGRMQ
jgi:hypothetical protein